jgi:hypothetical protein
MGADLALLPPGAPTRCHAWKRPWPPCARAATTWPAPCASCANWSWNGSSGWTAKPRRPWPTSPAPSPNWPNWPWTTPACTPAASWTAATAHPCGPHGQPVQLWIIGMGKLGARELNVSSDIDLIYVYEHDGETAACPAAGAASPTTSTLPAPSRIIYSLVGDTTEHGFVFRVDLALRPNGNSGPAAVSLAALEEYLQVQGREWERFAWLKSRVVAPQSAALAARSAGRCAAWCCRSSSAATWTTACSTRCAPAPADPRPRRQAQRRATPSAPTT